MNSFIKSSFNDYYFLIFSIFRSHRSENDIMQNETKRIENNIMCNVYLIKNLEYEWNVNRNEKTNFFYIENTITMDMIRCNCAFYVRFT